MPHELEVAAIAVASGLADPASSGLPAGAPCPNCGEPLHGRYCSRCGQRNEKHDRSFLLVVWDALEGLTHLDGRIAQTLPALALRPGRLVRDLIEGRRARHIPPFRLFLITLLLFMSVIEFSMGQFETHQLTTPRARAAAAIGARPDPDEVKASLGVTRAGGTGRLRDLRPMVRKALANPEYYMSVVFTWAHRLAILLLPITAFWLALLYFYKRRLFIYDHLITSMVFLSFVFLAYAIAFVIPGPAGGWAVLGATLWVPVNLFMILRGGYGSSVIGALLKTSFIWFATSVVFTAMVVGLLFWSLTQL